MRKSVFLSALLLGIFVALIIPAGREAMAVDLIAPVPGSSTLVTSVEGTKAGLSSYLGAIFTYGIGLAALIAMAQLIFGAVQYTTSAGAPSLQEDSKNRMRSAIIGIVLLIISGAILITLSNQGNSGGEIKSLSELQVERIQQANEVVAKKREDLKSQFPNLSDSEINELESLVKRYEGLTRQNPKGGETAEAWRNFVAKQNIFPNYADQKLAAQVVGEGIRDAIEKILLCGTYPNQRPCPGREIYRTALEIGLFELKNNVNNQDNFNLVWYETVKNGFLIGWRPLDGMVARDAPGRLYGAEFAAFHQ